MTLGEGHHAPLSDRTPNSVATYITHAPPPLYFPPQRRSSMASLVVTMLALAVRTRTVTLAYIAYRLMS
jgi:hypothetical protein